MYYCSSMPENQSEDTPAADRDHLPVPPMSLARWGTEDEARELSEDIRVLLRDVLEVTVDSTTPFDPAAVTASPSRLGAEDLSALAAVVGEGNVSTDDAQRLPRARGKSTPDLLAWRTRPQVDCPDAVVAPRNDDEVAGLLERARQAAGIVFPGIG